jgi:hypothetical protein
MPGDPANPPPLYSRPASPEVERLWRLMYPTPEEQRARIRARHQRWIAALSDRDWQRIRELQIAPAHMGAALHDLDAPGLSVAIVAAGDERRVSGERIGTLHGGKFALLVWEH